MKPAVVVWYATPPNGFAYGEPAAETEGGIGVSSRLLPAVPPPMFRLMTNGCGRTVVPCGGIWMVMRGGLAAAMRELMLTPRLFVAGTLGGTLPAAVGDVGDEIVVILP